MIKPNHISLSYFILAFSVLLNGCINDFEKNVVGNYKIETYSFAAYPDTKTEISTLVLNENKTFKLVLNGACYTGSWLATGNKNKVFVHFKFNNGTSADGETEGSYLNIYNQQIDSFLPVIYIWSFKKQICFN